ncbi:MAG: hypothetical protein JWR19_3653 [Pedosphaera sp.]|nr:hypothetical protein [Pedosphaera sp.]
MQLETKTEYTELQAQAESGDVQAQLKLGLLCQRESQRGFTNAMDEAKIEAYKWFKLAADRGNKIARNNRDLATFHMTREEVMEGNRRAVTFTAKR